MEEKAMKPEEDKEQETAEQEFPEFKGLPSDEEIAALKDKFGDLEMVEVGGDIYIYRRITRPEHRLMIQNQVPETVEDADEEIVKRFLVWPDFESIDWDAKGAGVIPTLSQFIMRFSGFIASSNPIKL